MVNRAKILEIAIRETGAEAILTDPRFVSPPSKAEVLQRLRDYGECVVVGPPRSGKTILAFSAGSEIKKQSGNVIYVDFNDVLGGAEDFQDMQQAYSVGKRDLFIADNCHSRPDCWDELDKPRKAKWKDANVLYLVTRFESRDSDTTSPVMYFRKSPDELKRNPINTEDSLRELAQKMITKHVEWYRRSKPTAEVKVDDKDLEQALEARARYKRMRGNLRYLKWRLEAWKPEESHLRDVGSQQVLDTIRPNLVTPAGSYTGDLERVAALGQWEVAYRIAPGQNAPEGFDKLRDENLIAQSANGAWYMDSTDAYLFLECRWQQQWVKNTEQLLIWYLEQSPDQVPIVLWRILTQAEKDAKRRLLVGLLGSPQIFGEEKRYLLQRTQQGNLSVQAVLNWAKILLGDPAEDETEKQKMIKLARELFSEEVGQAAGEAARGTSLQGTMWLLNLLKKDSESWRLFVTAFLASFGEDHLRIKLDEQKSSAVQRGVLRAINMFDPALGQILRSTIKLKPDPRRALGGDSRRALGGNRGMQNIVWWLASDTLSWGQPREERIQYLEMLEPEDLTGFGRQKQPLRWLQRLLLAVLWLAPEEARRIAGMVPALWPELNKEEENFRNLSLLITNLRYADPTAAADLVDLLLDEPDTFDALLIRGSSESQADKLSRVLVAMEHAVPGSVERWSQEHLERSLPVLASLDDKSLHEVLVPLAVFAPKSLKLVHASQEIQQRLELVRDNHQQLTRRGLLAISGLGSLVTSQTDAPSNATLLSLGPPYLLLALYGVQASLSVSSLENTLKELAASDLLVPGVAAVLLQMGRYSPPWTADQVIAIARAMMRPSLDPRTRALEYIVLGGSLLPELVWDEQWLTKQVKDSQDVFRVSANVRGLVTARFEELLLETTQGGQNVHARLNTRHPLVRTLQQQMRTVLGPLTEQSLSLAQWDTAIGEKMLISEADRWRYRLLRVGKVGCSLDTSFGRIDVKFFSVREPRQGAVRQLVFGEADSA